MSFSRAKIHRFNDVKPLTPSPADYNPIVTSKPKNATLPQSDRFVDHKEACETTSTKSTPCFKTPTMCKVRRPKPLSNTKAKATVLFSDHPQENNEALQEKLVELYNKDASIKDLNDQIEELKETITSLQENLNDVNLERSIVNKTLKQLEVEYNDYKQNLILTHEMELNKMESVKNTLIYELKQTREELALLKTKDHQMQSDLKLKQQQLEALETSHKAMQEKLSSMVDKMEKEHMHEIQDIEFEMLKLMTDLQKEKDNAAVKLEELKLIMERKMVEFGQQTEEEKQQILFVKNHEIEELEKKLSLSEQATHRMECKLANLQTECSLKLAEQEKQAEAILKECQVISEYNIIQSELEKNQLKDEIETKQQKLNQIETEKQALEKHVKTLNEKYENLQVDYNVLVAKFDETCKNLKSTLSEKEAQIQNLLHQKHTFEVTIKTSQMTIEVLKTRLINSDNDVEQLIEEIKTNEEKLVEMESKNCELASNFDTLQREYKNLQLQYDVLVEMTESKIAEVKSDLTEKINSYKLQVQHYCQNEKEMFNDVLGQLNEQKDVNTQAFKLVGFAKEEFNNMNNMIAMYQDKEEQWKLLEQELSLNNKQIIDKLYVKENDLINCQKYLKEAQEKCDLLGQQVEYYKDKIKEYQFENEEVNNIHKKYIEQSGKYDQLLQKYEELEKNNVELKESVKEPKYNDLLKKYSQMQQENAKLKQKLEEQTKLIEPFEQQLEAFEMERENLLSEKCFIEKTNNELSQKYASIVGHQNLKQKVKHLMDIKAKNDDLIQVKHDLECKVRSQMKTIEKLKKENSDLQKGRKLFNKSMNNDKENTNSPNRSLNTSRLESPGPLRDRN